MAVETHSVYGLFAELLEYPRSVPVDAVRECRRLVEGIDPEAAPLLEEFETYLGGADTGSLQEVYTQTFDLEATWHPYVGYHLFGETYQRSVFLVALKDRYQRLGFVDDSELPDHLPVMLRFLSICDDEAMTDEIVTEGILPMLLKMWASKKKGGDDDSAESEESEPIQHEERPEPYKVLLEALTSLLHELYPEGAQFDPAEITNQGEISVSLRTS